MEWAFEKEVKQEIAESGVQYTNNDTDDEEGDDNDEDYDEKDGVEDMTLRQLKE